MSKPLSLIQRLQACWLILTGMPVEVIIEMQKKRVEFS